MALELIPAQDVRVGDTIHLVGQPHTVTEVTVGRTTTAIRSSYTLGSKVREMVSTKPSTVEVAVDRAPVGVINTVPDNWTT